MTYIVQNFYHISLGLILKVCSLDIYEDAQQYFNTVFQFPRFSRVMAVKVTEFSQPSK